ncbi:3-oxoacid CoA-transferase [Marivirga arenosa]|uniref:3-oxoacid CoA-transferase n=1 Tax=Marivirga arenosa TaxID=3059076 RepID=A0AA49GEA5_9BACT|nr:3-oxoacid CoA-transferase [Marivirga sp. ABR2-2]WKK83732.1 3-oxoacid CoA-transferase [Marivirga sp. ABR2-2]
MKNVPIITAQEAAKKVKSNDTILCGGFGMTGAPVNLLHALAETDTKQLTYIGNNVGEPGLGGDRLLTNGQLKKMIGSYFTSNPNAVKWAQDGKVDYALLPQGTLGEAIRAGGMGIGGFFTPTAAGTVLAKELETKVLNGVEQVFVNSIRGNVAFIRAWKADKAGNLTYRMTEQNFNPAMATAADLVIAEVEEIVEVGELDPNHIHTQACFVDFLVESKLKEENLGSSASVGSKKAGETRMNIARRALKEISKGDIVNLGIGIPTLVADLIKAEDEIVLHTENGMLGVGPEPSDGSGAMVNPVNAGKIPVTAIKGASYFDTSTSFGMIRGKHVDVAIMGGLEVDEKGNLANWAVPGKPLLGVGGAMDLASGAKKLIITMSHLNKDGSPKLVKECNLPVTAMQAVDIVITDKAVFRIGNEGFELIELMPGETVESIEKSTGAPFKNSL